MLKPTRKQVYLRIVIVLTLYRCVPMRALHMLLPLLGKLPNWVLLSATLALLDHCYWYSHMLLMPGSSRKCGSLPLYHGSWSVMFLQIRRRARAIWVLIGPCLRSVCEHGSEAAGSSELHGFNKT